MTSINSYFSAEIVNGLDYNHKKRTRRFSNLGDREMSLLNTLAPFGIGIFTIGAIAVMCGYQKTSVWFSAGALLLVGVIYSIEKLTAPKSLTETPEVGAGAPAQPAQSIVLWVDTGTFADWGGRDDAYTKGDSPKYGVHEDVLCDDKHVGFIAVCWSDRPNGYPPNVTVKKDFTVPPPEPKWCTYKNSDVTILTPPDGKAPKGRVFLCARAVKRG